MYEIRKMKSQQRRTRTSERETEMTEEAIVWTGQLGPLHYSFIHLLIPFCHHQRPPTTINIECWPREHKYVCVCMLSVYVIHVQTTTKCRKFSIIIAAQALQWQPVVFGSVCRELWIYIYIRGICATLKSRIYTIFGGAQNVSRAKMVWKWSPTMTTTTLDGGRWKRPKLYT